MELLRGMTRRSIFRAVLWTSILAAIAVTVYQLTFYSRESSRWAHCIGQPIESCRRPDGYQPVYGPCPDYLDCHTSPPGETYVVSISSRHQGEFLGSYVYAVISLEAEGRVVAVEVKRFYSAP